MVYVLYMVVIIFFVLSIKPLPSVRLVEMLTIFMTHEQYIVTAWLHLVCCRLRSSTLIDF